MNRRGVLLFLLFLSAILYLSLYPVRPGYPPMATELRWAPLFNRGQWIDFILNVAIYIPLGAAAFVALRAKAPAILGATLLCGLISLAVEYAQLSIPWRHGNLRDLAANTLGALVGALLAFTGRRVRVRPSVALFVILWVAWQGLLLLRREWTVIDVSHELVGLLVLAMVFTRRVSRLAGPLLLVWLAVEELRPFQFQGPPGAFSWVPFEGWFLGSPESLFGTLAGKLFLYTAVIWVLHRSGARMFWAFLAPATILGVGEYAQRYLPGRTPEITDLALLAAGGALLLLTDSDD